MFKCKLCKALIVLSAYVANVPQIQIKIFRKILSDKGGSDWSSEAMAKSNLVGFLQSLLLRVVD